MPAEDINPELLRWARETAGLTVDQAAEKLELRDTRKASAAEKLIAIERGTTPASGGLLRRAAALYNRPLLLFYLPEPPRAGERGADFRTHATRAGAREEALLDALVRDVRARQQMLREVLVEFDEAKPMTFVGSASMKSRPADVAAAIRQTLRVGLDDQRRSKDANALFRLLRDACGAVGIYVLLLGDLGSYHSDLDGETFRGVALADEVAPIVVVNDNDAPAARGFTLLHELAHVWIGASGVSGPVKGVPVADVERFCNAVASEFLLPEGSMSSFAPAADVQLAIRQADDIARVWNVSATAVIYRAVTLLLLPQQIAGDAFSLLTSRWKSARGGTIETRESDEGGPSYYTVRRSRLGTALLDVVGRALRANAITHTSAGKILGVAPYSVDRLLWGRQRAA